MRAFCVECGTEGFVYEGLCADCLPKKRSFVSVPGVLELTRCTHCGRFDLPGGWQDVPLDQALELLLRAEVRVSRDVVEHRLSVDHRAEGPETLRARYAAHLEIGDLSVVETGDAEVRRKGGTCPECARQRGDYFEAVLQVRATDRSLTGEEQGLVQEAVTERIRTTEGLFLTKYEVVHGGLDFYLSSSEASRGLARDLARRLGGELAASPRLHGRKAGRELYRVTYRVRLPPFAAGDVLKVEGRPHRVLRLGRPVLAVDLTTGRERGLDPKALAESRPTDARTVEGVVLFQEGDEVEVLDTETQETLRVAKPAGWEPADERVLLIRTAERTYLAPLPRTETS